MAPSVVAVLLATFAVQQGLAIPMMHWPGKGPGHPKIGGGGGFRPTPTSGRPHWGDSRPKWFPFKPTAAATPVAAAAAAAEVVQEMKSDDADIKPDVGEADQHADPAENWPEPEPEAEAEADRDEFPQFAPGPSSSGAPYGVDYPGFAYGGPTGTAFPYYRPTGIPEGVAADRPWPTQTSAPEAKGAGDEGEPGLVEAAAPAAGDQEGEEAFDQAGADDGEEGSEEETGDSDGPGPLRPGFAGGRLGLGRPGFVTGGPRVGNGGRS